MKAIIINNSEASIFDGVISGEIERAINNGKDYHKCGWLNVKMDGGDWEARYIEVSTKGGEYICVVINDLTNEE